MYREVKEGEWLWLDEAEGILRFVSAKAELYVLPKAGEGMRLYLGHLHEGDYFPCFHDADLRVIALITRSGVLECLAEEFINTMPAAAFAAMVHILSSRSDFAASERLPLLEAAVRDFVGQQKDYFARQQSAFKQRLRQKKENQENLKLYGWVNLLQHDLDCQHLLLEPQELKASPLTVALKLIALKLNLPSKKIAEPADLPPESALEQKLAVILSNSGLHARKVMLNTGWHKKDQGCLLVFKNGVPLAAVPDSSESYELLISGRKVLLDDQLAEELDSEGYVFYQELPRHKMSLPELGRWCLKFCWKADFYVLFFACFIAGLIPIITPFITENIFSDIIPDVDKQALLLVVQVMFVATVSTSLLNLVRGVAVIRLKYSLRLISESALWLRCLALPAAFFRKYQIGDLAQRMTSIGQFSHAFSSAVSSGIFNGIFTVWNLLVMLYYSGKLSLLAVFIWGIYLLAAWLLLKQLVKKQRQKITASGESAAKSLQLLSGINKFRLRGAEEQAFMIWAEAFGREWKWNKGARWYSNWLDLAGQIQPLILTFFLYWLTMHYLDESRASNAVYLTQAQFLGFNSALSSFGSSLGGLIPALSAILAAKPSLDRIRPILEEEPEVSENKQPAGLLTGEIEFSAVDFRYRSGLPLVLQDINFSVKAGEFLAVVGSSGSGKSTLLRLLLGLEKPERGIIQFNGQDLAELDVSSVRRQMGVVLQNGRLMAGSIKHNITGSLLLTRDEVWEAVRMVGLEDDVKDMPMGIDTVISEGAGNISGGQKQRILIARSLVHRPKIIVFDEATSALDNNTQDIVARTLEKIQATRIVVAHRLSTIQKADRILVLEQGKIAESGTYDELMSLNGLFAKLARRQLVE